MKKNKPKVIILGINNDKDTCVKAVDYLNSLGFECSVFDPRIIVNTPEEDFEILKSVGSVYPAEIIYRKSKYHK